MNLVLIFIAITSLFYLLTGLRSGLRLKICSLCLAVSLTWLGLLVARQTQGFDNDLIIAVLMGESVVGLYYWLDSLAREDILVFRLPALLTLTYGAYTLVAKTFEPNALMVLGAVWLLHLMAYLYRSNKRVKKLVDKAADCCGRW